MKAGRVPDRGDLVWIDFSPHAGHEQGGRRPAIAISRFDYNRKVGLALFCPITSRAKGYPFEVPLPSGSGIEGVVLCDQIKSMDWTARGFQRAGRAPDPVVNEVLKVASTMLR